MRLVSQITTVTATRAFFSKQGVPSIDPLANIYKRYENSPTGDGRRDDETECGSVTWVAVTRRNCIDSSFEFPRTKILLR